MPAGRSALTRVVALAAVFYTASLSAGAEFERIATYRGLGALVASAVGPGPSPGTQRLYLSYLYVNNTIDVVAVDPGSGRTQVFPNPAPTESGARCMTLGPDGNMYLGTLPTAHFLKLDTREGKLIDLGRPSSTEEYIWDVAFGADARLYGATYPQSKLVRYDPKSGKLEDLGRMDPVEQYAHFVVGSNDGFVYVGIGTSKANIAAYKITTGEHREILPAEFQTVGQASVYRGVNGKIYGKLESKYFRLEQWKAIPIAETPAAQPAPANVLSNGSAVTADGRMIRIAGPSGQRPIERHFDYSGNLLDIFRLGLGPDDKIYASSILPIHLLRISEDTGRISELGDLGGGEIYSFLSDKNRLLAAAYAGKTPLMVFDPAKPFDLTVDPTNPKLVNYEGSDHGWRPQAMIAGWDDRVFIGAVAGYGRLGGPLVVWNLRSDSVQQFPHIIQDQSVVSLAVWKHFIVGGTTIRGGGGSHPTQKDAKIFLWDPETRRVDFETAPVSGAGTITDLLAGPNGWIYGIAETGERAGRAVVFAFDPVKKQVVMRADAPFPSVVYNAATIAGGTIWGLASTGIFKIETGTNQVSMVASSPKRITAGFVKHGKSIYFASGPEIWRWKPNTDRAGLRP
jgi:hypothetical protein